MTKTIWKFQLHAHNKVQSINVPADSTLLSVHSQFNKLCLWAICPSPFEITEARTIALYTTGEPLPENCSVYLGTVLLDDGLFVLHAFDITGVAF